MHETTTKDIHNHHKETQKQLQNYTHADVHTHAKKTDAPNDTTVNRLHTDSKQ